MYNFASLRSAKKLGACVMLNSSGFSTQVVLVILYPSFDDFIIFG